MASTLYGVAPAPDERRGDATLHAGTALGEDDHKSTINIEQSCIVETLIFVLLERAKLATHRTSLCWMKCPLIPSAILGYPISSISVPHGNHCTM